MPAVRAGRRAPGPGSGRGVGLLAPGGKPLRPRARCVLAGEPAVDLDEVVDAEIPPCLRRRASEGQVTVPGQEDHPVAPVNGGWLVSGEDNRDPSPGELVQQAHDLRRRRWVQTRGGFVQEEGGWPGEQLDRDAGALALTPRQHPDRNVTPIGQIELAQYVIDHPVCVLGRCARGQPEPRRVLERAPQRPLDVDDVVLRDIADAHVGAATGIDPYAVVHDVASRGRPQPCKNLEQGGLSRSAAAHERNQLTRLDGEGHRLEDVTPPGVLADADGVDAGPDGSLGPRQRRRAGRGHGVRGMKRELCHEVPPWGLAGFVRPLRPSSGYRRDNSWSELGEIVEAGTVRAAPRAASAGEGSVLSGRAALERPARIGLAPVSTLASSGLFPGCAGFPAPWAWRPLSSRRWP